MPINDHVSVVVNFATSVDKPSIVNVGVHIIYAGTHGNTRARRFVHVIQKTGENFLSSKYGKSLGRA